MKAKTAAFFTALLTTGSVLSATPLAETVAVRLKPDAAAPAFAYLKAGAEPAPADGVTAPAGWAAVGLPGPHDGYVQNGDLAKSMDVRPDAPIYTKPDVAAPVLTLATRDDKTEITGMTGKWVQIKLDRKLVGYYQLPGAVSPATTAAVSVSSAPTPSAVPVAGRAAQAVGDQGPGALPRQFTGTIVEARRLLGPRPIEPYQLNDDSGTRFAYLDLNKLLFTERIENYLDRPVVVFGTAHNLPASPTIVIEVETLQLRQ